MRTHVWRVTFPNRVILPNVMSGLNGGPGLTTSPRPARKERARAPLSPLPFSLKLIDVIYHRI